MALSSSIPTSFVPKQPGGPNQRRSGTNILFIVGLLIFLFGALACAGTFLYSSYLKNIETTKGQQLVAEQKKVDPNTVEQFVRLKNRLTASQTLMRQHIELSQFLDLLGTITLDDVSFKSMSVQVADDRTAQIQLIGQAASFNALAAESKQFAAQPYIKSAIFSNIAPSAKDNTVAFTINATLDPRIVVESQAPTGSTQPQAAVPPNGTTLPTEVSTSTGTASAGTASSSTTSL